jgi:Arc/MetJ-type ribon-helix-helix transcriptional regulator
MSTNLSPENEAILADAVAQGVYSNANQALDEALRLLRKKLEIERALTVGMESGEPIEANAAYWDAKRAALQQQQASHER